MTKARDIASATTPNANAALLATFPHRNLIINGAATVNQRGNVTGATGSTYGGPDRFYTIIGNGIGTWNITQDTDVPSGQGFANSWKIACTTADASPAAADHLGLHYRMEGQNLQQLSKGTSDAKSVTLSFWVKCNKTGDFQVTFRDSDNTRHIASAVTISSTATWQYVTITFAGDTTGAFDNDNANSAIIEMFFDAGTDWTSGSVPTTWQAAITADRAAGTNLALADSTSNYINITGIQLEVGSTATPFEHRSYGDELARCQRYACKLMQFNGNKMREYDRYRTFSYVLPVEMRATPTVPSMTTSDGAACTIGNATSRGFVVNSVAPGDGYTAYVTSELVVTAEL